MACMLRWMEPLYAIRCPKPHVRRRKPMGCPRSSGYSRVPLTVGTHQLAPFVLLASRTPAEANAGRKPPDRGTRKRAERL